MRANTLSLSPVVNCTVYNQVLKSILIVMCIIGLVSCAQYAKKPISPLTTKYQKGYPKQEIEKVLQSREICINTFWAKSKIYAKGKFLKGTKFTDATLIYKKPDLMRLRAYRNMTSTLFDCLFTDTTFSILDNNQQTFYTGSLQDLGENPSIPLKFKPQSIINALLINDAIAENIKNNNFKQTGSFLFSGNTYKFKSNASGTKWTYYINKDNLLPQKVVFKENGKKVTVIYHQYDGFGQHLFPSDISIMVCCPGYEIRIKVSEIKTNPQLRPEVFQMFPPKDYKVIRM